MRKGRIGDFAFVALCTLGGLSMVGHVMGLDAVVGLGFVSAASPLPLVFSESRGVEGFAGEFEVLVESPERSWTVELTSEHYARLQGPYNLRNAYGAAIAGAPILTGPDERAMVDSVLSFALCPGGPLWAELGGEDIVVRELTVTSRTAGNDTELVVPIQCP